MLAFGLLNMIQGGALLTLGPVLAKNSDLGEGGWGLILSAEALGFLLCSLALMRLPLRRPLRTGMIAVSLLGLPMLVLGFEPVLAAAMVGAFLAGVGMEVFGLGWNLAMQEHVPDEMLSRAYSYDALGSFVAIPVGQLLFGPLGTVFGIQDVMLVSGVAYIAIALLTLLSRSVRDLPGRRRPSAPLLSQRTDHRQVAVGRDPEQLLDLHVGQPGVRAVAAAARVEQVHRPAADPGDLRRRCSPPPSP